MYVRQDNGIIVVGGKVINSKYTTDKNGLIKAVYYIRTFAVNWTDPTGATGASRIDWVVYASGFAARLASPSSPFDFETNQIIIEGTPIGYTSAEKFWRKGKRAKQRFKLKALFTEIIEDDQIEDGSPLVNYIAYHPQGSRYNPWWRPDIFPDTTSNDSDSNFLYNDSDQIGGDFEFFYQDERWSRDP